MEADAVLGAIQQRQRLQQLKQEEAARAQNQS